MLSQQAKPEGLLQLSAFYSHLLTPAEHSYAILDWELLAIKVTFEVWCHHLKEAHHSVQILTDHWNLEYLQTTWQLDQRQVC